MKFVHNDLKYAQWRVPTIWEIGLKIDCLSRSVIIETYPLRQCEKCRLQTGVNNSLNNILVSVRTLPSVVVLESLLVCSLHLSLVILHRSHSLYKSDTVWPAAHSLTSKSIRNKENREIWVILVYSLLLHPSHRLCGWRSKKLKLMKFTTLFTRRIGLL